MGNLVLSFLHCSGQVNPGCLLKLCCLVREHIGKESGLDISLPIPAAERKNEKSETDKYINVKELQTMDEALAISLVSQFLLERGYLSTLKALETESNCFVLSHNDSLNACLPSGRKYVPEKNLKCGQLQAILDNHALRQKQKLALGVSPEHLFEVGCGEYANRLLKSFEDVGGGVNVLVVRVMENGVIIFGASKSLVGIAELSLPPTFEQPPVTPIFSIHSFCQGGVLALDVHPSKRNLVLCGSMDRLVFILDLSKPDDSMMVQKFESHSKYVVRVLWSTSGYFFITASYDKTVCVYKIRCDESGCYDCIQKLSFKGAIESVAFSKDSDQFVVGVRDDCFLHCYSLSSGVAQHKETFLVQCRKINMNSFGDDYVSFVPMHISFSPDGHSMLISTDQDKLILYSWNSGKQIASFYGATNDELSQPRCCWDHSGKYVYGTSQDKSIFVWEVRSQAVVCKLEGHTATVRDLFFCNELKLLISCSFDGSIKLWKLDKEY